MGNTSTASANTDQHYPKYDNYLLFNALLTIVAGFVASVLTLFPLSYSFKQNSYSELSQRTAPASEIAIPNG